MATYFLGYPAKRKREEEKEKLEKTNNSINKYFNKGLAAVAAKPKVGQVLLASTPIFAY